MKIDNFKGEYGFLSNFQPCKVIYNGVEFDNAEAAFQAQKCPNRISDFIGIPASTAKSLGRRYPLRSDWEEVKDKIMYEVVDAKFSQNEWLKEKLLQTGNAYLIEGNTWHDYYWGYCNGRGKNKLGIILMALRDKYKFEN